MTTDNAAPQPQMGLYRAIILLSLLLTFATLILSAHIRLSQSGLNCQPWPDCYGQLNLQPEQRGIGVLTNAGADTPQQGARIAHRFIASTLGLLVVLIVFFAIRRQRRGSRGLLTALSVFAVTLFLAVLGYQTPTRALPWVTLGNLAGGTLLLVLLWWLMQRATSIRNAGTALTEQKWIAAGLALLFIQALSGAWASANFTATACHADLLCGNFWRADKPFAESFNLLRELTISLEGISLLPEKVAQTIAMTHRGLALLCLFYLGFLCYRLSPKGGATGNTAKFMGLLLVAQLMLGLAAVYSQPSATLITLHNLLTALLLLCLTHLFYHSRPAQPVYR